MKGPMKTFITIVACLALALVAAPTIAADVVAAGKAPTAPPSVVKFEGRTGVTRFVLEGDTLRPGTAFEVSAPPVEALNGALDASPSITKNEPAKAALVLQIAAASAAPAAKELGVKPADVVAVTARTHKQWVQIAAGVTAIEVPELVSGAIELAEVGGDPTRVIEFHLDAEDRIEALKNPGFFGSIAWWWSR